MNNDYITLKNDLLSLGLSRGECVLIHSSYKSMGNVEGGIETLFHIIKMSVYSPIEAHLADSMSSGALERICDDHWMKLLKDAKYINFGAGVLAVFIHNSNAEITIFRSENKLRFSNG